MKSFLQICILAMASLLSACGGSSAQPKGKLIYCSYSETRHAGLGKSYCELVADDGKEPYIAVRLDLDSRIVEVPLKADIPIDGSVVEELQELLAKNEVYKLDGYHVDEMLDGGATFRIHMEYSSGETVTADWFGVNIREEAWDAYYLIEGFFEPWRQQAREMFPDTQAGEIVEEEPEG